MKKLLALILCGLLLLSFPAFAEGVAKDGAYNVVGRGFYGDLNVTVTIADGKISDITVADCPETHELGGKAIEIMTAAMVENNTSGVDSVTGATVTSAFFRMAVNEALKQAEAPDSMKAQVETLEKTEETLSCDVLVMGSGTAGLSAAIAAAEAGANVIVIEKQDIPGGSAVTSAGIVYAPVDENDKVAMVQYYMDRAEGNANEALLQFYADNALDTISWLESLGVQWLMTVPAGTAPEPRARFSMTAEGVGMTGAALVNPMLAKIDELGVQLLCGVRGTELLVDENGAITGAKAESKAAEYTINARSVILATGGFDASKEMKAEYSPVAENDFPLSSKGNVGDGIRMGMAIGAATEFKGGVIGFDFVDGLLPASGMNAVAMYCSSYVQPDGTFVSKVIDYPITYTAIKELSVPNFYGLYDAKGAETAEAAVAVGFGWKGETVEELAEATGMDAVKLADAIEQDPDLTEAPYYAVMVKPTTIGSMGGLVIDTDAQVLREDGSAIPGLYATGEVANGGFYYVEYPASGSSLSLGMTFGLEAGRNAAAYTASSAEDHLLLPLYGESNVAYAYDGVNAPTKVTEVQFLGEPLAMPMVEEYDPYISAYTVENPIYTVIFFPGSGYFHMNSYALEGTDIAKKMNERGISCFVCGYRVSPNDYRGILADGQRAVRWVRYHADEYGVDPEKIAVFGFSAGGHMALMTCEYPEYAVEDPNYVKDVIDEMSAMPNACLLGYPVVTMEEGVTFEPGAQVFFNGEATKQARAKYSAEDHVPENMPPVFMWLCADDNLVPNANSLRLAAQLDKMNIPYELHVFREGTHGIGLAEGLDCAAWFDLSVSFINRVAKG